jgi:hypothetical protein
LELVVRVVGRVSSSQPLELRDRATRWYDLRMVASRSVYRTGTIEVTDKPKSPESSGLRGICSLIKPALIRKLDTIGFYPCHACQ